MRTVALVLMALAGCGCAAAGGPRFVAGPSSSRMGSPMAFAMPQVAYYTDPGSLSSTVSHAQADAVVASAAAVWNVPTSNLVLSRGGTLSEHVSGANTYFDGSEVVFPADVQASNYASKPIAVIYDTDGSVIDLLLGAGASAVSGCRQTEVVESVDGFGDGVIQHAMLIVNGRCVGPSTDQLNQLKYALMRGFGRVLGMGWSQTNDVVFTGAAAVTAAEMAYWPVMHPIDVICGPYTYLCMQNPFSLRPDDLSVLAMLYPVTAANITPGKQLSVAGAMEISGQVVFPVTAVGADQINFVVHVTPWSSTEQPTQVVSGLSGYMAVENSGNPVAGLLTAAEMQGDWNAWPLAAFDLRRIPIKDQTNVEMDMEAVNPLYTGEYALLPGGSAPISPSGTIQEQSAAGTAAGGLVGYGLTTVGAPTACWLATNGSETAPQPVDGSGWWHGLLCSKGSPSWGSVVIRGGRSWTLESTALDETGAQTTMKAQPVIGVWNASDATGTLPTVAAMAVPMNSSVTGMTQLQVTAAAADGSYRFTMADAFGHGRPDLAFQGRVLYADAVTPAVTTVNGGQITITGMGFANGNRVTVNGAVVKVLSWSSTAIVAMAPTLAAAKVTAGVPVDVSVEDLTTGGVTTISGALAYPSGRAYQLAGVSAPSVLETGMTAGITFAVKVVAADGVTAVPGASVRFAVTVGGASLVSCGAVSSCLLVTDAGGVAQTMVAGVTAGSVMLTATEMTGGASVQVSMVDVDPARSVVIGTPTAYVAAGASVSLPVVLEAMQDGAAAGGVGVGWSVSAGMSLANVSNATGNDGSASVVVGTNGMAAGTGVLSGCAWTGVCATWNVVAVDASQWVPGVVSGAGQSVSEGASLGTVVVRVTDASGHALVGATVSVAQTVYAWEGVCGVGGRCPAAPVLASNVMSAATDASGLVTVVPLELSGVPQVLKMAVSSGTSGFLTMSLVKVP